jgi:hypothetical protein
MMPIVLTGDVHQTIGSSDQRFTKRSEASLAVDYARIAGQHGLKVTLFFTGRAIVEDGKDAKPLLAMNNVEIGGHGWDALRPRWWHRLLSGLTGSPHGPQWLQRRMIERTCATLESFTRQPLRSWRNHAYRHDQHTAHLLSEVGIVVWSDQVQLERPGPFADQNDILILPINTLPDHENMYHGARTPRTVAQEGRGRSYPPSEWRERVSARIEAILDEGGIATILAHPICMQVADEFATFNKLGKFLSRYPSLFASEVPGCTL